MAAGFGRVAACRPHRPGGPRSGAGWWRAAVAALVGLVAATPAALAGSAMAPPVFAKCHACHAVEPDARRLPGPNLAGVLGRRAASVPGFEYSPAMVAARERGLAWSRESLDRFLADPQGYLPGTYMGSPGLRDAAERRAVIEYLAQATGRPGGRRGTRGSSTLPDHWAVRLAPRRRPS
jgi:cytochrome c